jgi:hypothetical protein
VAELLGRHKSWVCWRLALIERLGPKARDELRVGLVSPTAARQIVRLPEGNQAEVLDAVRRRRSRAQNWQPSSISGCAAPTVTSSSTSWRIRGKRCHRPGAVPAGRDPRLSEAGNHVWKRVGLLLDVLGRMEVWLGTMAVPDSLPRTARSCRPVSRGSLRDAASVAALSRDLVAEMKPAA